MELQVPRRSNTQLFLYLAKVLVGQTRSNGGIKRCKMQCNTVRKTLVSNGLRTLTVCNAEKGRENTYSQN